MEYDVKSYYDYVLATYSIYDVFIGIIFTIILLKIGHSRYKSKYKKTIIGPFFWYGLLFKLFCGWLVTIIYRFYYIGGDTFMYYAGVLDIRHETLGFQLDFMTDIWSTKHDYSKYGRINENTGAYLKASANAGVIKIGLLFNLLCFNSFIAISLCFSFIGFIGMWRLFKVFISFYPKLYKEIGIVTLFYPSAVFWSSGLMKDPICIGGLGLLVYYTTSALFWKKNITHSIIGIVISGIIVFIIKSYIIIAFAPAFFFWVFLQYNHKIKNKLLRKISSVFVILISVLGAVVIVGKLTSSGETKKFAADSLIENIKDSQKNTNESRGGSKFSLGELDPTPLGVVKMFPAAVNASLFRPYLWEVHNPVILLSALESAFLLFMTILLCFKVGPFKLFATITSTPLLLFCLIFTIIFSGAVGLSCFNFGSLVRYKIPCLPFYAFMLTVLWNQYKLDQKGLKKKPLRSNKRI
jgi:hypothetical protein